MEAQAEPIVKNPKNAQNKKTLVFDIFLRDLLLSTSFVDK